MSARAGLSVGVDVGGTFTDLVGVDETGAVYERKVLSTPRDQSEGVAEALRALGVAGSDVARVVHGTTVATNALLERSGARVVLCATAGATDLLALRRQDRASLYDLTQHHPAPLVPPTMTVAVRERLVIDGVARPASHVVAETPLDAEEAADAATRAARLEPDVVAVMLLHAYADPAHEQLLARALCARMPGADVVLSSDVLPEVREFERASTTVAEAYLRPVVGRYLRRLSVRLEEAGFPAPAVMTSSGGVRGADDAARAAASLALSGPAGGVVGAAAVARAAAIERALTIDIGGTSADVGLILDGEPLVEPGGAVAGVPIALPRVLVETVSAGGGSIGWVDDGGALRVGPRSAGAVPGPAAFGRGGTAPTVTDAHVVLGSITAARLSGGVTIDVERAHAALEPLAARLDVPPARAAGAMIATADATMARALRRMSVERGVDPRGCTLIAFGGGGPLHACGLADRLGMRTVLVPPHAGVLSALGLAISAERREAMASVMRDATDVDAAILGALLERLAASVLPGAAAPRRAWWVRARYRGQGHELDVPADPGDDGPRLSARFANLHAARYGFVLEREVELVSARHATSGAAWPVCLERRGRATWSPGTMVDDGGALDAVVRGPAVIGLPDATLLVADGWSARALPLGGWMLERQP